MIEQEKEAYINKFFGKTPPCQQNTFTVVNAYQKHPAQIPTHSIRMSEASDKWHGKTKTA